MPEVTRHILPDERQSITHKFDISGHQGYITVGLYENGEPGEMFLTMAREGSTVSGFADAFAQAITYCLQYGVPLEELVNRFSNIRFEPSGMSKHPDVRYAKSVVDYIFRWLELKFLTPEAQAVMQERTRQFLMEVAQGTAMSLQKTRNLPVPEMCLACATSMKRVRANTGWACPQCHRYVRDKK